MSLDATFFSSYPQLFLAGLIVLIAQTIYVFFGFGLGLVAFGLLALFIQPVTNIGENVKMGRCFNVDLPERWQQGNNVP